MTVGLGFGLALILELASLTLLVAQRAWRAVLPPRDLSSAHLAVLAIALATFSCRLLHSTALLQQARLKLQRDVGSPRDELLRSLAELVLGAEGCTRPGTRLLHQPCRQALRTLPGGSALPATEGRPEASGGASYTSGCRVALLAVRDAARGSAHGSAHLPWGIGVLCLGGTCWKLAFWPSAQFVPKRDPLTQTNTHTPQVRAGEPGELVGGRIWLGRGRTRKASRR